VGELLDAIRSLHLPESPAALDQPRPPFPIASDVTPVEGVLQSSVGIRRIVDLLSYLVFPSHRSPNRRLEAVSVMRNHSSDSHCSIDQPRFSSVRLRVSEASDRSVDLGRHKSEPQ
jgi:hypothetical protein